MEATLEHQTTELQHQWRQLANHLNQRVIGQEKLITQLLIAVLADGHLLVEGAPGLAKTTAIKELARCIEGEFQRIQFTPDLLPADLTGTDIFRPQDGSFVFEPGPIFHQVILADEINRAPAKVQSALLEAMGERQVTIGRKTYPLPPLFLVMATQNPIEQEGTYPLPEAQLDRFLLYITIDYPSLEHEKAILQLNRDPGLLLQSTLTFKPLSQNALFAARTASQMTYMSPALDDYIVQLIIATRNPANYDATLAKWLRFGASPRGTIALDKAAKAHAWLSDREYVTPEDIHAVIHPILRHRLILSFEAQAEGITSDAVIDRLLQWVTIP